jgi:hypothetical protein
LEALGEGGIFGPDLAEDIGEFAKRHGSFRGIALLSRI